jgi:hypothetical protein
MIGAAHGAAECAVLFLFSDRYTLANDWFLAVMVVFANATGFAVATRYGVNLLGVALAGLVGMGIGGWVGVRTIGSIEYTVPTPKEDRELRIITKGQERVIELTGVPEETVKRVPVGGGLGVLVGFAVGALLYARIAGHSPEPLALFNDPVLGPLLWSEDDESWVGEHGGYRIAIGYSGLAVPDPELLAYARDCLGPEGATFTRNLAEAREARANEFAPWAAEFTRLRVEVLRFWLSDRGMGCFVDLVGGEPERSWRVEFEGLKCLGFGFDT